MNEGVRGTSPEQGLSPERGRERPANRPSDSEAWGGHREDAGLRQRPCEGAPATGLSVGAKPRPHAVAKCFSVPVRADTLSVAKKCQKSALPLRSRGAANRPDPRRRVSDE